jgi:hypothetical protein
MKDKRAQERIDHNNVVIERVVHQIRKAGGLFIGKKIKIVCGHLHKSNKHYPWTRFKDVEIYPLGIDEVAFLSVNGKIKTKKY